MKPFRTLQVSFTLALTILTTSCSHQVIYQPTSIAQVTALVTSTELAPSPTFTNSPSSTPSATITPTVTQTPTKTHTAIPSPTRTATLTYTPKPLTTDIASPTLSVALQPAPVFAQTPMLEFDADTLIQYLGVVRDSFRSAYRGYAGIDNPGGCSTYNGWLTLWLAQAPGFSNVPVAWYASYHEYRSWLQQAVSATWEHHLRCTGDITDSLTAEQVTQMADFFNRAYPRFESLLTEAQQLPR